MTLNGSGQTSASHLSLEKRLRNPYGMSLTAPCTLKCCQYKFDDTLWIELLHLTYKLWRLPLRLLSTKRLTSTQTKRTKTLSVSLTPDDFGVPLLHPISRSFRPSRPTIPPPTFSVNPKPTMPPGCETRRGTGKGSHVVNHSALN